MYEYVRTWLELKTDKRAVTGLEWGLIASIVVVVGLVGFSGVGTNVATKMTKVKAAMT